jgi:hypothetical protein
MAAMDVQGKDRDLLHGHGPAALGPSDSSDTGSDIVGGPGLGRDAEPALPLSPGTNLDEHVGDAAAAATAGADIGDADLSGDSDASGTGEHVSAGRDIAEPLDRDRGIDRIVVAHDPSLGLTDGEQLPDGHTLEPGEDADPAEGEIVLDGSDILEEIEADLEDDDAERAATAILESGEDPPL